MLRLESKKGTGDVGYWESLDFILSGMRSHWRVLSSEESCPF